MQKHSKKSQMLEETDGATTFFFHFLQYQLLERKIGAKNSNVDDAGMMSTGREREQSQRADLRLFSFDQMLCVCEQVEKI